MFQAAANDNYLVMSILIFTAERGKRNHHEGERDAL